MRRSLIGIVVPVTWRTLAARPGFAALVLATLVFASFYVLQDYGPETAVRRFHRAAAKGDLNELDRLTFEGVDSRASRALRTRVLELTGEGGSYRVVGMQREPRRVQIFVVYRLSNGTEIPGAWVVELSEGSKRTWKIRVDSTIGAIRQLFSS